MRRLLGWTWSLLVVSALAASPARADDEDLSTLSLEELLDVEIDVGSFGTETVFRTPSSVTVITRDTIAAYGYRTLAEALDGIAGYDAVRTYSTRDVPTIRGLLNFHYANKVLVMIDGVPTWSAVTGHTVLQRIPIEAVERIEVLKGPASVVYGSNAYAGAINVVLRRGGADGRSARAWTSLGGAYAAAGAFRMSRHGFDLTAAIEAFDDGESEPFLFVGEDTAGLVRDFSRGGDLTATLRRGDHSLLLNRYTHQYMRFGATPSFADGAGHDQIQRGTLLDYHYRHRWLDRLDTVGSVTWDHNERNFDRSADGELRTNDRGWRLSGYLDVRLDVRDDVRVEAGGTYELRTSEEYRNYLVADGSTVSDNNMRDRSVREGSWFAQAEYRGRRLSALVGTRLTANQRFGLDVASRAAVSYAVRDTHAIKLLVGQAFRAPSLFELYFTTDTGTTRGNPDLDPERSTSVELVDVVGVGHLLAQTTAYLARYDRIIYRRTTGAASVYDNGDTLDALGVELELAYRAGDSTAFASGSYLSDLGGGVAGGYDILAFTPALLADVGAASTVGPVELSGVAHYRSATSGPDARIGFAWTLDAGVGHPFELAGHPAEVRLDGRNLTDQRVEFPEYVRQGTVNAIPRDGFGRQIFLTLRWSL